MVISAAVWGAKWAKCSVLVQSDNMAAVHCLTTGTARDPLLMHLLWSLHFITPNYQIDVVARHVPGVFNTAADVLSHNAMPIFLMPPHRPKQRQLKSQTVCWTCYSTTTQTGSHPIGGKCFSLPGTGTSTSNIAGI